MNDVARFASEGFERFRDSQLKSDFESAEFEVLHPIRTELDGFYPAFA
jgi:hypothetical protein